MDKNSRLVAQLMTYADFSVPSVLHSAPLPAPNIDKSHWGHITAKSNKRPQILWFFAEWCGHCRRMRDAWDQAVEGGVEHADWHEVDCGEGNDLATHLKVRGFPTVKKVTRGKVETFEGQRTRDGLINFAAA